MSSQTNISKTVISVAYFLAILTVASTVLAAESAPYPEPPSQEELDRLKQAGDENLRKYGSGQEPVVTIPEEKPRIIEASPSSTPEINIDDSIMAQDVEDKLKEKTLEKPIEKASFFSKIWNWFTELFKSND